MCCLKMGFNLTNTRKMTPKLFRCYNTCQKANNKSANSDYAFVQMYRLGCAFYNFHATKSGFLASRAKHDNQNKTLYHKLFDFM